VHKYDIVAACKQTSNWVATACRTLPAACPTVAISCPLAVPGLCLLAGGCYALRGAHRFSSVPLGTCTWPGRRMWPSVKYTRSTTTSTWLSNPLYRLHKQAGTASQHCRHTEINIRTLTQKIVEEWVCHQGSEQHMLAGLLLARACRQHALPDNSNLYSPP
jgi:hypothetical protein